MSNIVTNKFNFNAVKALEEKFSNSSESVYFFYGNPLAWDNEASPDTANPTNKQEHITKSNLLALKKITDRDLILGVTRVAWTTGTRYDAYTDAADLTTKNFYVITSNNQVFKCLNNDTTYDSSGVATIAQSTIEPSGSNGEIVTLADGYTWKHMFDVSEAIQRKFTSTSYIPIDVASASIQAVVNGTIPGTVDSVTVDAVGVGYFINVYNSSGVSEALPKIPLFIEGDGDEVATGTIRINQVLSDGAINLSTSATLTGVFDLANPTLSTTAGFEFTDATKGSGYIQPTANDNWSPIQIRQISSETSGDGSSFTYAYGIAKINASGSIDAIRLLDGGTGYTPGVAEVVQSKAIAYANTDPTDKYITGVEIESRGRNFSRAKVVIISDQADGVADATLTPVVSPFKGHGADPEIELNAHDLLFNIQIAYEELGGDFSVANDFRSVGIIESPKQQAADGSGDTIASASTLSAKTDIVCKANVDVNDFAADLLIIGKTSGARAKIVDVVNNNTIRVIRDIGTSNTTDFLANEVVQTGAATAEVSSVTQPEYVPFSGDMLFINNRIAIQRSSDQIETINFILKL
jgi:hypothetical protein